MEMYHFISYDVIALVAERAAIMAAAVLTEPEPWDDFGPSKTDLIGIPPQDFEEEMQSAHDYVTDLRITLAFREWMESVERARPINEVVYDSDDFGAFVMGSDAHLDAQVAAFESNLGLDGEVDDEHVIIESIVREAHAEPVAQGEPCNNGLCSYEGTGTFVTVDDRLICDECVNELIW